MNNWKHGKSFKLCDAETNCDVSKMLQPGKVNSIMNYFLEKRIFSNSTWASESQIPKQKLTDSQCKGHFNNTRRQIPRSAWKFGIVEAFIKGKDINIRQEIVWLPRTKV